MIVDLLETTPRFTPLGLRFWDPVLDRQIRDDLVVKARPHTSWRVSSVIGYTTLSGIYTFQALPGMTDIETGAVPDAGSPAAQRRFIVEVVDAASRYLPIAIEVALPLPYRGVFLGHAPGSPGGNPSPGLWLFPAPTRRAPRWLAVVRGELAEEESGHPAAHALVQVTDLDGRSWYGVSDDAGRFVVLFAYPTLEEDLPGSPHEATAVPLLQRRWDVELTVRYSPSTRHTLPGTGLPEYESILTQHLTSVWDLPADDGGSPRAIWTGELQFGRELQARTGSLSRLLVDGEMTSP